MIVAIKKDDRVVVGVSICDSSIDMTEKDLVLSDNIPFWKVKGEKGCYVCTEYMRYSTDLLRFSDYVFKGITDGRSIIEEVVPKMKELLDDCDRLVEDKNWCNQMVIIKGNSIFTVDNYFCLTEEDDFAVIGYEDYFKGAIEATRDMEPTESILAAVRHTSRMTNRQLFPITIFDTRTKRRKVYYR